MDIGEKLRELNLSSEEMDRFTKAFKDGQFKEMFREYVQEISEPENRRKHEEQIKQLEQERGNMVEFIRPTPFKVIKTSSGGKHKCFINICANDKIQKAQVTSAVSEEGRRGQCWTLPHSLHPGRTETDPEGNTILIYDVVFHPDTLHMASKNRALLDMVKDTAVDGVQRAFKVNLDKNNVREVKTKYKGTPQTCVIRRPIPGYNPQNVTPAPPCLEVPQPQPESEQSPQLKNSRDAQQQLQSQKNREPTKPNYTVKYRSRLDLQDFRCSRDSVQSSRPQDILITIDLPLLRSVKETNLEVKHKSLLLECRNPFYRLHLALAYSVDEDRGEAKFNKHTGQLTVTLPVRPPDEAPEYSVGQCDPQGGQSPEEQSEVGEEQAGKGIYETNNQEVQTDEREEGENEKGKGLPNKCSKEDNVGRQEIKCKQTESEKDEREKEKNETEFPNRKEVDDEESGSMKMKENQRSTLGKEEARVWDDPGVNGKIKNQETFIADEQPRFPQDKVAEPTSTLDSTSKTSCVELQYGSGKAEAESPQQPLPFVKESQISPEVSYPQSVPAQSHSHVGGVSISGRAAESHQESVTDAAEQGRGRDEDDLPAHKAPHTLDKENKLAAAWSLREIDADGKETLISDHSTSAGFVFHNKLMYELD